LRDIFIRKFSLSSSGLKDVHTLPSDAIVIMDYRTDRIRVYVDEQGKVASAPHVG